jgi:hypothetical protein
VKRDLELVREILIAIEANNDWRGAEVPQIAGRDRHSVCHHIEFLAQAGYLSVQNESTPDRKDFHWIHLIWNGHEFLDALRNETVWAQVKEKKKSAGGSLSFELAKELGITLARQALGLS